MMSIYAVVQIRLLIEGYAELPLLVLFGYR